MLQNTLATKNYQPVEENYLTNYNLTFRKIYDPFSFFELKKPPKKHFKHKLRIEKTNTSQVISLIDLVYLILENRFEEIKNYLMSVCTDGNCKKYKYLELFVKSNGIKRTERTEVISVDYDIYACVSADNEFINEYYPDNELRILSLPLVNRYTVQRIIDNLTFSDTFTEAQRNFKMHQKGGVLCM